MTEQPARPVTIYDVAAAAGVAPSTVSRTFARPGRVNAATAEKVHAAAARLGYRPAPTSQALAESHTRLIGVMVFLPRADAPKLGHRTLL